MIRHALEGVRVLDLTHVLAGPTCTMLLADLGADVVKVEPPSGEIGRRVGPPWVGDNSAISLSVNRNKKSLAINLKTREGKQVLCDMAADADVIVESFRPGVMQRLGLDYPTLTQVNNRLIYCSISAFGQVGHGATLTGVDGVAQAASGLMSVTGHAGSPPAKTAVPISDMTTGHLACLAVLAALTQRHTTNRGQYLDVSLFNASIMLQQTTYAAYFASGSAPQPMGSAAPYACPNEAYPTKEGWLMVAAYQPTAWRAFCNAIGAGELVDDPRFGHNQDRLIHREELFHHIAGCLGDRSAQDWQHELMEAGVMCTAVADYPSVVTSDLYKHSGLGTTSAHPTFGTLTSPGFSLGPSSPAPEPAPPPAVGEHSKQVLSDYGFNSAYIDALIESSVVISGPQPALGQHQDRPHLEDIGAHE